MIQRMTIGLLVAFSCLAGADGTAAEGVLMLDPVDVSCTTTSAALVVAANGSRKMIKICNVSDADVYYRWGGAAVVGAPSLLITPKGCHQDDIRVPINSLWCITATGTKHLSVQEGQ